MKKRIPKQYKEVVLYEIQDGKRTEIRRIKFMLTETEQILLNRSVNVERKLRRARTALTKLEPLFGPINGPVTVADLRFAQNVLSELRRMKRL